MSPANSFKNTNDDWHVNPLTKGAQSGLDLPHLLLSLNVKVEVKHKKLVICVALELGELFFLMRRDVQRTDLKMEASKLPWRCLWTRANTM